MFMLFVSLWFVIYYIYPTSSFVFVQLIRMRVWIETISFVVLALCLLSFICSLMSMNYYIKWFNIAT